VCVCMGVKKAHAYVGTAVGSGEGGIW
jgi:hypothetical protein